MKSFKEFYEENKNHEGNEEYPGILLLFESKTFKPIPGTKKSYREDSENTNTKTAKHSHVYAKPKGKGKQIYAVDVDGKGHDGSTGKEIPKKHANFFKGKGYSIATDNILECIDLSECNPFEYSLIFMADSLADDKNSPVDTVKE